MGRVAACTTPLAALAPAAACSRAVPCGRQLQPITCERFPIRRFHGDLTPTTAVTGRVEAMALWPGESVGGVTSVAPAATIVQELVNEAERVLGRWAGMPTPA